MGRINHKVVIAIDFGTARSGYAYAFVEDAEVVYRDVWPGQQIPYVKTLTHLLYSPEAKVESWGFEAPIRLADLRKNNLASRYTYFQNFKMQLREGKDNPQKEPMMVQNGRNYSVVELITQYLRIMKEEALKHVKDSTAGYLKDEDVRWCLTVPAIWTDAEKRLMRRAAENAGIIGSGEDEQERLLLVLEPEAAAIYCQRADQTSLKDKDCFMIIDCGGGTVDITVHEVSDRGLREVTPGNGGAYGAKYVDDQFMRFLRDKFSVRALDAFHDQDPVEFLKMTMEDWERLKVTFDPKKTTEVLFPIRPAFYSILLKQFPDILDMLANEQNGDDSYLHLSTSQFASFFEPVLEGLVSVVKEQFRLLGKRHCDYIYLVGGFSTSALLQKKIEEEFGNKVKKVVKPPTPGLAIVAGAVTFGLEPELIRTRRTRLTYGTDSTAPFREGIDPESKKFWANDLNAYYAHDRFTIFVRAGDEIEVEQPEKRIFTPVEKNQRTMTFDIYATRQREGVDYVDQKNVTALGKLSIDRPNVEDGLKWEVEVTMYFGQTELRVEAYDPKTGQRRNTTLRFSSTHSPELIGD